MLVCATLLALARRIDSLTLLDIWSTSSDAHFYVFFRPQTKWLMLFIRLFGAGVTVLFSSSSWVWFSCCIHYFCIVTSRG